MNEHIAAFDPPTVLALIERLRRAEALGAAFADALRGWRSQQDGEAAAALSDAERALLDAYPGQTS